MLKRIRAFVAVVEAGSFTAAARRLGIAQPAISLYIRQLEEAAGTRLIDRQKHRLRLTDVGVQLFAAAQPLIEHADKVDGLIRHLGDQNNRSIRIGSDSFSGHIRARNRIVDDFIENFPNVELSVRYAGCDELLALLRSGEIDLAFMTLPVPDGNFDVLEVATIRYALLAPAGFWPDRVLRPDQLRGRKLLLGEEKAPPSLIAHIKRHLAGYDIAWVHPSESEMSSRARMVKATGIPTLWFDGDAAEPGIKQVDDLDVYQLPVTFFYHLGLVRTTGQHRRGGALFWNAAAELVGD
jgi:DNA-binding transcriptional LysR family regulator